MVFHLQGLQLLVTVLHPTIHLLEGCQRLLNFVCLRCQLLGLQEKGIAVSEEVSLEVRSEYISEVQVLIVNCILQATDIFSMQRL